MENGTTPVLLTITQATAVLHQSRSTLYRKIKEGQHRALRLGEGGPLRIETSALAEHLRERVPTPERSAADLPGGADAPPGTQPGRAAARHTNDEKEPHENA